jgi:glycosyltransferase involved in cell wall biosynthesis
MWEGLPSRFDVAALVTNRNMFELPRSRVAQVPARALQSYLPRGALGGVVARVIGERYVGIEDELDKADIVHAEELSYWFAADVARRKSQHDYRLVLTVWETLPFLEAFRNRHARVYRRETLGAADLFLAATERARESLLLEGVEPERIEVCYPGVDTGRFARRGRSNASPDGHLVISPGRLVWEKGHQDVMRALAALRRTDGPHARLLVVGEGPERSRLEAYARELSLADSVEFRSVPYDEMPSLYARASCLVLASLSSAGCMRYLGDLPHCFWEEQFGLVLAEAMAAGLPIVASRSGAIPEVVGETGSYFSPGDWPDLARVLAEGPLSRTPAEAVEYPPERIRLFSTEAAAERLAVAYDQLIS